MVNAEMEPKPALANDMQPTVRFDAASGVLTIRLSGIVDDSVIQQAFALAAAQPIHDVPVAGVVWDARAASLSGVNLTTLRGDERMRPSHVWNTVERVAVIVGREPDAILMRLWETGAGRPEHFERRTFRDHEDAYRWVSG